MADEDALLAVAAVLGHFDVHLGHQRAGGVEYLQATACSFLAHGLGDAMGAEDDDDVVRHLVELFDEDGATVAQVLDHELVVHHFVAHIDRRAEDFQARLTISIARSTPAQKPRGLASLICMLGSRLTGP